MIGATLEWRGLIEVAPHAGPIAMLGYRPTYRFKDDHRLAAFDEQPSCADGFRIFGRQRPLLRQDR